MGGISFYWLNKPAGFGDIKFSIGSGAELPIKNRAK